MLHFICISSLFNAYITGYMESTAVMCCSDGNFFHVFVFLLCLHALLNTLIILEE